MTDPFLDHRSQLFGIAYRMLGSVAEAEDAVQEVFLRWRGQDAAGVDSPKAWLIAATTRYCIDQLRSARRRREEYVGVWLPEPLVEPSGATPREAAALADSLGMAFMVMLEELEPAERAVFLLRQAFDYDYAEIARIVEKSEAACRQIVSRAKGRLAPAAEPDAPAAPPAKAEAVVQSFLAACASGNVQELLAVLTDDVVLYTDGGGRVRSALRPILRADRVCRFFLGLRKRGALAGDVQAVSVNGRPGFIARRAGGRVDVTTFAFAGGRIRAIYTVSNPDKLTRLPAA
jgi:RNA polymerase sigma-70 factor (ECF subfamily)